jgi:cell fate regulator YaaT (PSP1 superfamily)
MPTVVGVKLRFAPKTQWFAPNGFEPLEGDTVIVDTDRGTEVGTVTKPSHEVPNAEIHAPLKPLTRVATPEDMKRLEEFAVQERAAIPIVRELIAQHELDMKPIEVEYLFDGEKVVFYFVAEERVDFRELVKDLATRFRARIDMRQVGVRDEARIVGGLGHCGEQLCCVRFGGEFQPVSIRMAKEQDLPLNPLKISGLCGRLMCCLRYEYEAYKDYKGRAPKKGAIVETPLGLAKVAELNTPHETVGLRFEDGRRVSVPLAEMSCNKGTGCPCQVSREALEAVGNTATALAFAALDRETEAAANPPVAEKPREQRRERPERREPRKASPRSAEKPAGEQAGGDKVGGEPAAAGQAPKSEGGGRKRRRRGGGRGGGEGSAATPTSGGTAGTTAAQPPAAAGGSAEQGAAKPGRKRRRRRPGASGSGDAPPA